MLSTSDKKDYYHNCLVPRRFGLFTSIKLIHAAHAKGTQALEQHIAPAWVRGRDYTVILFDIYIILWSFVYICFATGH